MPRFDPAASGPGTVSRRTLLLTVGAAGATVFGLAACGDGSDSTATPARGTASPPSNPGGTVRWTQPAALDHLDPHTTGFGGGFAVSLVYDTLFRLRRTGDAALQEIEPHLAASFEQPEPTRVLLRLDPAARFQDREPVNGRSVTAEDVVFSLRRVTSGAPEFVHRSFFEAVEDIDAPEDGVVALAMSRPFAPLLRHLATPWPAVVPREVIELRGDLRSDGVGSGPFVLQANDETGVVLARSANWWRTAGGAGLPNLDSVSVRGFPRAAERFDALLAGQTDAAAFVPFERAPELDERTEFARADYPLQDFQYVRFRTSRGALRDVRVRRALSLATDRSALVREAFGGRGVAHAVLPSSVKPWALPIEDLPYYRFDPEQATQLLAAAGFDEGLDLTNLAPENIPLQEAIVSGLTRQWRAVGVEMASQASPYGEYLDRTFAGTFEVNVHWGNRYDDVDGYVAEFETGSSRNFGAWGDPEVDQLIQAQRAALDPQARLELLSELQTSLAENAWAIGTASWLNTDAWTARLQDTEAAAEPYAQTRWLGESWLQPGA
jgi:peptide/nickel transport system substrate-binding protein